MFRTLEPWLSKGIKPLVIVYPQCPGFRTCSEHCLQCDRDADHFGPHELIFSWGIDHIWFWDVRGISEGERRTWLIDKLLVGFDFEGSLQNGNENNIGRLWREGFFERYRNFLANQVFNINIDASAKWMEQEMLADFRVLWINRQDQDNRAIVNYDELIQAIQETLQQSGIKYRFQSLKFEAMPARDQVKELMHTPLLLSYMGAADAQILYLRPGAAWLSCNPAEGNQWNPVPGVPLDQFVLYRALRNGPPYYCGSPPEKAVECGLNPNWTKHRVDTNGVRRYIRELMCALLPSLHQTNEKFCS